MERLRGVEETGGNPSAIEGGGDFLGDVGRLAHAAEDQLSARRRDRFDRPGCFDEFYSEAFRCRGQRGGLDAEASARAGECVFRVQGHLLFESQK